METVRRIPEEEEAVEVEVDEDEDEEAEAAVAVVWSEKGESFVASSLDEVGEGSTEDTAGLPPKRKPGADETDDDEDPLELLFTTGSSVMGTGFSIHASLPPSP